jgi:hypothetical protein
LTAAIGWESAVGEARRKLEARCDGVPEPRPSRCPACGSRRIRFLQPGEIPGLTVEHGICLSCRALWEAFPPLYVRDEVCAEPCDNCAFRPGSPEQRDAKKWKALIESLDPTKASEGQPFSGRFYCHKNVPIDMARGPGNFLFPKTTLTFRGVEFTTENTSKMRTCSGFLRMVWAKTGVRRKQVGT